MPNPFFDNQDLREIINMNNGNLLVKSDFAQRICGGEEAIIWHSLFGKPKRVSLDTLELIDFFSQPQTVASLKAEYDAGKEVDDVIRELTEGYILISPGFNERRFLEAISQEREAALLGGGLVRRLDLKITEECNFRCRYCVHFISLGISDRLTHPEKFMSLELARKSVDEYVSLLKRLNKKDARITFSGGEVLIAWSVLEQVVLYYNERYAADCPCSFSIMTNASLVTAEIAKRLRELKISVATSIDGLGPVNDLVRITKSGAGTFARIIAGFNNLEAEGIPIDACVTVNDLNLRHIDESMIDWAAERGMKELRVTPDMVNMFDIPVPEVVDWLKRLRACGKIKGIDVTGGWHRPFSNFNDSALERLLSYCEPICGDTLSVAPSGLIYGCCYSTSSVGAISRLDRLFDDKGEYRQMVSSHIVGRRQECFGCEIEGSCAGACEITRESAAADRTAKVNQMCELFRQMTRELFLEMLAGKNSDTLT
jgi:uncharacterized protein